MNKTLNIVIGVLAALALIVGVVAYNKTPSKVEGLAGKDGKSVQGPQGPQGIQGPRGFTGPQGPAGRDGTAGSSGQVLGAVSGPDIFSPYLSINGVRRWYTKNALFSSTNGTTTPCAIQSPNATSTLILTSINITTSTSTSGLWTLATSTTAFATTTSYGQFTVGANKTYAQAYIGSSTQSMSDRLFSPSSWIVYGVQGALQIGATNYGHIYGGNCQAVFQEL